MFMIKQPFLVYLRPIDTMILHDSFIDILEIFKGLFLCILLEVCLTLMRTKLTLTSGQKVLHRLTFAIVLLKNKQICNFFSRLYPIRCIKRFKRGMKGHSNTKHTSPKKFSQNTDLEFWCIVEPGDFAICGHSWWLTTVNSFQKTTAQATN